MSGEEALDSKWSTDIVPLLNDGYSMQIPFSGLSMYPFLAGGRDEVIISSASGKKLRRGDIVLYLRDDGTHILHRIHHSKHDSYFMVGDAQTFIEGPINSDKILAIVTALVRKRRTISCDRTDYRFLTGLWLFIRPIRPLVISGVNKVRSILKI